MLTMTSTEIFKGKIITSFVFLTRKIFKLLVMLFIIKLYVRINIFRHIKKKYGQDIIRVARKLEDLINKHIKIQLDINFIKTCKRKDLIPTFAKENVAIDHGTQKLKMTIVRSAMETEMQIKHYQKKED